MKIAIFGLGYVGLTAAGCLASSGHKVIGIDVNADKVAQINAGLTPIAEPGLGKLIAEAVKAGLLQARQSVGDALGDCEIAIVCVGTPSAPDGSHNMSFIAEVSRQIAHSVDPSRKRPLTVAYRSTFRPGTIDDLVLPIFKSVLKDRIGSVEIVYNPEFLRESVAVADFYSPPKIVIGTIDGTPSENMDVMNSNLNAPVFYTGFREAEFTKFVDNTFHALKVAFANEIGRVCVELRIDVPKVHEIFISDTKLNISPYYLRPGGAFGGSCLPKDVRALQFIASDVGVSAQIIDNIIRSNEAHKHFTFIHVTKNLAPKSKVLLFGLAFKADSDDLRESPSIDLARKLIQAGYELSIYDETLDPSKLIGQNLGYGFSHLPSLEALLVTREVVEQQEYDRLIDTNGRSSSVNISAKETIRVDRL